MTNKSPSPTTDATNTEKLEALFNDQRLRNAQRPRDAFTFASRSIAESDEVRGRFAAHEKAMVVGPEAATQYPRQPDGSFSNQSAVVGPEEPLGFSVDEVPIVGEGFEITASLERLEQERAAESMASSSLAEAAARGRSEARSSHHRDLEPAAPPIQSDPKPGSS